MNNHENSPAETMFHANNPVGRAIRRASARMFITQSAGNHNVNACTAAFNYGYVKPADAYDGIMVVGGTDQNGNRYPKTKNPEEYYLTEDASNYGPCVEIWAPGANIPVLMADGAVKSATGTSFAAPAVAAIAARYGDSNTRPIERETYIHASRQHTGTYENAAGSNLPIYQVRYTAPSSHSIPKRLPVSSVYSVTNTENLDNLVDGKFYESDMWNAHSQQGQIVIDLGAQRHVTGIRFMLRSSATGGNLQVAIHGGNDISHSGYRRATLNDSAALLTQNHITDQFDLIPYYLPISGKHRYIMLTASNDSSWLAFSEIEIYGK